MEETIKNSGAQKLDVKRLTVLAMLAAVIVLMTFTPIGYLKVGAVSITFIMIPVVIGAVVTGPREVLCWVLCSASPALFSALVWTPLAQP